MVVALLAVLNQIPVHPQAQLEGKIRKIIIQAPDFIPSNTSRHCCNKALNRFKAYLVIFCVSALVILNDYVLVGQGPAA